MKCKNIRRNINSYIEKLTTEKVSAAIEEHLKKCAECRREVSESTALKETLTSINVPEKSAEEWEIIYSNIRKRIGNQLTLAPEIRTPNKQHVVVSLQKKDQWRYAVAASIAFAFVTLSAIFFIGQKVRNAVPNLTSHSARLVYIQGTVFYSEVAADKSPSWQNVLEHLMVKEQNSIKTSENSDALLQCEPGTALHIKPKTELTISRFSKNNQEYILNSGTVLARIAPRSKNQHYSISTPHAIYKVVGTRFLLQTFLDSLAGASLTRLVVTKGRVDVYPSVGDSQTITVESGHELTIWANGIIQNKVIDPQLVDNEINGINIPIQTKEDLMKEYGYLNITTEPSGTLVLINGNPVGVSPLCILIKTGEHQIEIRKENYLPYTVIKKIEPRITTKLIVSLTHGLAQVADTVQRKKSNISNIKEDRTAIIHGKTSLHELTLQKAIAEMNSQRHQQAAFMLEALLDSLELPLSFRSEATRHLITCYRILGQNEKAVNYMKKYLEFGISLSTLEPIVFDLALILYNKLGDYGEAANYLRKYISDYPHGAFIEESYMILAEIYYLQRETDKAITTYNALIEKFDGSRASLKAMYQLANLYQTRLKNYKEAVKVYSSILEKYPHSEYAEDALFWRGDCYFRDKKFNLAKTDFDTYITKYPAGIWTAEVSSRLSVISNTVYAQ